MEDTVELGPIEIVAFALPGRTLDAGVLAQMRALVGGGAVRIVDAVLATKDADGTVSWAELADDSAEWGELISLAEVEGLVAEEDVAELVAELAPGSSALVLAFENAWLVPLLAAVRDAGGDVIAEVAVPDSVVREIVNSVPNED